VQSKHMTPTANKSKKPAVSCNKSAVGAAVRVKNNKRSGRICTWDGLRCS